MTEKNTEWADKFRQRLDLEPLLVAEAPGRVNRIGEHIDYMHFPVFPAATSQRIFCLGAPDPSGPKLRLEADGDRHAPASFAEWSDLQIQPGVRYENYVVAAVLGAVEELIEEDGAGRLIRGTQGLASLSPENRAKADNALAELPGVAMFLHGNVPEAAGLSSSSALVVSVLMAIVGIWSLPWAADRKRLTRIAVDCERHVGTASGGMDQTCIINATPGAAQVIHFAPTRVVDVSLPEVASFVVLNTFKRAEKAQSKALHYNKRVFECRIATAFLWWKLTERLPPTQELLTLTLRDVFDRAKAKGLVSDLESMGAFVRKTLPTLPVDRAGVTNLLGMDRLSALLDSPIGWDVWHFNTVFEVTRRALHVYSEADRVWRFQEAATAEGMPDEQRLAVMGHLMSASHRSLCTLYDASCPELEEMVSAALANGALGCRLTGAGWGGWAVCLVPSVRAEAFVESMRPVQAEFGGLEGPRGCPFLFTPAPGAGVSFF